MFKKFNETNLQLQGDDFKLIDTKPIISVCVTIILMNKRDLGQKEFIQFLNLNKK